MDEPDSEFDKILEVEPTRDYICPRCGLTFYLAIEPCCGRFSRETFKRIPHAPTKPVPIRYGKVPRGMDEFVWLFLGGLGGLGK